MEEELSRRAEKKSRGVLWQRSAGESMPIGIRVVHRGSDSFIPNL